MSTPEIKDGDHPVSACGGNASKTALFYAERPAFEKDMIDYGWRDFNGRWDGYCWYYDNSGLQHRWFGWHRRAACEASAEARPTDEKAPTSAVDSLLVESHQRLAAALTRIAQGYEWSGSNCREEAEQAIAAIPEELKS